MINSFSISLNHVKLRKSNATDVFSMDVHSISTKCARTEFVGTAVLDTIGLVIQELMILF